MTTRIGGVAEVTSSAFRLQSNQSEVKHAVVSASAGGATTQVAAVAGKKISVLAFALTSSGIVNVKFQSHTAGDVSGLFYEIANTGFVLGPNEWGWFETVTGEALDINLSAGVPVGGVLTYVEVIP
jgi:hypothetical protein